jgi:hypothetical protein
MIRERNEADANAQLFVANDEFLLSNLKPFFTLQLLSTRYWKCSIFSVCVVAVLYTDGIHLVDFIIMKLVCFYLKRKQFMVFGNDQHATCFGYANDIRYKYKFHVLCV